MTCKECGQVVRLTRTMNKCRLNTELSSHEETRSQFSGCTGVIKLGIDVHQQFYTVVMQEGGSNPKPLQFNGQSRDRTNPAMVETSCFCRAQRARLDKRASRQQPTDPARIGREDPRLDHATASRG